MHQNASPVLGDMMMNKFTFFYCQKQNKKNEHVRKPHLTFAIHGESVGAGLHEDTKTHICSYLNHL